MPEVQLLYSVQTLAVATIYCIWRAYREASERRQTDLRDRVTYMLWVMANEVE
jgi:hypothetical protein